MGNAAAAQISTAPPAAQLPQPQTTLEPPGGPFVRYAQVGRKAQYVITGASLTALITAPLVATQGYIAGYRLRFQASGGTGVAAVYAADAPYNLVANLTFKDAYGITLLSGSGYSMLHLVPKWSGQDTVGPAAENSALPSWVAGTTAGNFSFATYLPLQYSKANGLIAGANAAAIPSLQMQLTTAVFSTQPTGAPTIEIDNDNDFYWLPGGANVLPPGLGTTCQWIEQAANPLIGSLSNLAVQVPRMGGYLHTIILVLRDSTNARIDAWPTRIQIAIDGVAYVDSRSEQIFDDMAKIYWNLTRETGVMVITRKNCLSQMNLGFLDTGEQYISSNPGTQLTVSGTWGTITNAPATLIVLMGQVVPAGNIVQGLPEV